MRILGIESSCDETSASVVDIDEARIDVRTLSTSSSMNLQATYGGVVPEVAARKHVEYIIPVLDAALEGLADTSGKDIDLIAVTRGPGLMTSLAVGVQAAQTMGLIWNKPVVGVNHLEGHVLSPFIGHEIYASREEHLPILVLTVSGGHTMLLLIEKNGQYRVLGSTIDDAAGDAFDKVGKMLGLPYPGGPQVDRLAVRGNPAAFDFPRPMMQRSHYDFSFSGLKTSVRYAIRDLKTEKLTEKQVEDIAASFQRAVVDCLAIKTLRAAEEFGARTIFVAGGVGANRELRERIETDTKKHGLKTVLIDRRYSGDNAAMIAVAGYFTWLRQGKKEEGIVVEPKLKM